jgi:hypothetical protein
LHARGVRHRACWMANATSSCCTCQGCLWRGMPQEPCRRRISLAEGASIPCLQHRRYHICHGRELTHHRRCTVPAGCPHLPVGRYRLRPGVLGRGGADTTPGGVFCTLGSGVLLTSAAVAWVRCGCELRGAPPRSVSHADLGIAYSKPCSIRRSNGAPSARSIVATIAASSWVTRVKAIPVLAARPVRPMRCI